MKIVLVFVSVTLILPPSDELPTELPLVKEVKKLTSNTEQSEGNWRKCKPGDIHSDGCGTCICGPKNLFECTWEHCVGPVENWDEIILPHETTDADGENSVHTRVSSNASVPFFYSVSKHDNSVPFFYSISKHTPNYDADGPGKRP